MIVKVHKKENIIVQAMMPVPERFKKDRPTLLTVLFGMSEDKFFCQTVNGENAFTKALQEKGCRSAYFRCICKGDPCKVLPEIICEVPETDIPKKYRCG